MNDRTEDPIDAIIQRLSASYLLYPEKTAKLMTSMIRGLLANGIADHYFITDWQRWVEKSTGVK